MIQLAAVIFFTISGGPFGIEPLIGYAGDASLLLLAVTPLLWDVPALLMVTELNSMMPVSGGYYQWVKNALGLRWAFYEGWWTWLYTFVDLAIYPVFFVEYATFFFPNLAPYRIPVCLAVIWCTALLNIRGILTVGRASLALAALVVAPFILLLGVVMIHPATHTPLVAHSSIGMALYTIIWNYIGWDNATTYASEVDRPARTYFVSMMMAFGCIYLLYIVATYCALHSGLPAESIAESGFPLVAGKLGGGWFGGVMSAAGMASMLGIFNSILLSVSRVPAAMGEDRLLPKFFSRHHPEYDTPFISIILCSTVVSFLIMLKFSELLIVDITLYGAGLALEFISLVVLRHRLPHANRPFKVRLGVPGLIAMSCVPLLVFVIALVSVFSDNGGSPAPILFALLALVSAEIVWQIVKRATAGIGR